jgi:hypothetical protein
MSIENIRSALDGILNDWSGVESVPVAWENFASTTVLATPFVSPFLLPVETGNAGISISDNQDYTGIYQISVYTEKGKGTKASRDVVSSLLEAYSRGVTVDIPVSNGVQRLLIESSWTASAIDSEAWYNVPLSVRYRLFG